MGVLAIIPAYNEENTIKETVETTLKYCDVVVVDDCSSDNTYKIIKSLPIHTIRNKDNLGYELTLVQGLKHAIEKNYDYAITLDGDGQLSPSYIPKFINALKEGNKLVVGNRNSKTRWSEYLISIIGSIIWNISDPFCGLKGYDLKLIKKLPLYTRPSIGTEIAIKIAKSKQPVKNVSIEVLKRNGDSRIGKNDLTTNFYFLKCFLRNIFIKNLPVQ